MTASASSGPNLPAHAAPSLAELYLGFAQISMSAFGGALPWARRILVDQRGWMEAEDFASTLALCQFLPGPNIVNLSVAVGQRFRGVSGAVAAFSGLMVAPVVTITILGLLYERFGQIGALRGALTGLGAATAGLVFATAAQMAAPMVRKSPVTMLAIIAVGFVLAGLLRWPLIGVLALLAPIGVALAWRTRVRS